LKAGDQTGEAPVIESTDSKAPLPSGHQASAPIADGSPVATTPPSAVATAPAQPVASAGAPGPSGTQPPAGLLAEASIGLQKIREYSQAVVLAEDENARWKIIAAMYLSLLALARSLENSELHPAFQMCSALAGLLKKLQENPKTATPSTLHTVTNAVDLLDDLCVAGVRPDLADNPRVNILVVDDDPLTRRAISVALQTSFLKPDNAEDGESALTLAAEIPYDVIFMDVQMPGIDGFTACAKIHETIPNRTTPVVFVTSHTDAASREKSTASGGRDFVTKPFIFVEITVKALTFALRNRLALARI
jgi:CheY-like chemotaxis protein